MKKKSAKEKSKKPTLSQTIGRVGLCLMAAGMIPYRFRQDKETGGLEVRSLLWGVRKTPGEGKDNWSFAIPASGLDMDEETESA